MNVEPVWVSLDSILAIHDLQLSRFGGGSGLRDHGLLESAIARPLQIFCYSESVSLTQLAAAYAFGIIRNHRLSTATNGPAFWPPTRFWLRTAGALRQNNRLL